MNRRLNHLIYGAIISLLLLTSNLTFASAYLRCPVAANVYWYIDIPARLYPSSATPHVVHCGDSFVYISNHNATILDEQLRQGQNVVLKVDGEYADSPCF